MATRNRELKKRENSFGSYEVEEEQEQKKLEDFEKTNLED